jgi:hypothetical protein
MPRVRIPNNWTPRPYQLEALQAFEQGKRRQSLIWHRRAGKDSFAMNLAAKFLHENRCSCWHLFPTHVQARRAIWYGIGANGERFIDQAFPMQLRTATRNQEMMVELAAGSTYQMAGSDRYDSLVGANVRLVIFSEWALCDPRAWDYVRPIIRENNGAAIFITTYRGKNHAYRMHKRAQQLPDWFATTKTVLDTTRQDGSPVLSEADIQAERDEGMSEELVQQEYYCDPRASYEGSYWGLAMRKLEADGRLTGVAHEASLPVVAAFDLGMDDDTSIIFIQEHRSEVRILKGLSFRRKTIDQICQVLREQPFSVSHLYLPHDARIKDLGGPGISRAEQFKAKGFPNTVVPSPPNSKMAGIEAARSLLNQTWINAGEDTESLVEALYGYRTEESRQYENVFQLQPAHSWESHFADAWQCYAKGRQLRSADSQPRQDLSHARRRRHHATPNYV